MRSSRSIILAPATVGVVWTACFIYVAVLFKIDQHSNALNPQSEAQRDLGSTGILVQIVEITAKNGKIERIPLYSGPIDLWNGELWRLPINALHHVGLLHLLMNGCAMLFMGKILEPRLGKFRILLFYLIAATVTGVVPALFDVFGVGLSGVAYAQVGLLMVWRDRDEEVAEEFPYSIVVIAGIWLVGCQIATYANLIAIDNAAHYSGLVYGWLFGQAYLAASKSPLPRFLFAVGHVFLIPAFWFAMHPFWSGNWHWYRASAKNSGQQQRLERLQAAVLYDPSLAGAWYELTQQFQKMHDEPAAFRVALEGFRHNPEDPKILNQLVEIWADARLNAQPLAADEYIQQTFDEDAERWTEFLHSRVDPYVNRMKWNWEDLEKLVGLNSIVDPKLPDDSSKTFPAPNPDPNAPESALGGLTM